MNLRDLKPCKITPVKNSFLIALTTILFVPESHAQKTEHFEIPDTILKKDGKEILVYIKELDSYDVRFIFRGDSTHQLFMLHALEVAEIRTKLGKFYLQKRPEVLIEQSIHTDTIQTEWIKVGHVDGNWFTGKLVSEDSIRLCLSAENYDTLCFPKVKLDQMIRIDSGMWKSQKIYKIDAFESQYFILHFKNSEPNKRVQYRNILGLNHFILAELWPSLYVQLGLAPFSQFNPQFIQPLLFQLQYRPPIQFDKMKWGFEAIYFTSDFLDPTTNPGRILYLLRIRTKGRLANLSVGGGVQSTIDHKKGNYAISTAGEWRIRENWCIMAEGLMPSVRQKSIYCTFGLRYSVGHSSFEMGLVNTPFLRSKDESNLSPWLGCRIALP
ncbi:MAG: hypothetical protein IPM48_01415 [Saprospiraceae bacterium]|nr:hypothetical protein [Saprospiraceae bacterium]